VIAVHIPVPLVPAVALQPALPFALPTLSRRRRSLVARQTAFKNLHPSHYPKPPSMQIKSARSSTLGGRQADSMKKFNHRLAFATITARSK